MIEDKLLKDITEYCELNGIEVDTYINKRLKSALMIDKYGTSPFEKGAEVSKANEKDFGFNNEEPKRIEPKQPKNDCQKEKTQKKQEKKAPNVKDNEKKSEDGKIIVNKRILK